MKQAAPHLHYKKVDESIINLNDFITDADVIKKGSTAILAILFHYLDEILGGHPVKEKAWEQFSHSEKILKFSHFKQKTQRQNHRNKCNNG